MSNASNKPGDYIDAAAEGAAQAARTTINSTAIGAVAGGVLGGVGTSKLITKDVIKEVELGAGAFSKGLTQTGNLIKHSSNRVLRPLVILAGAAAAAIAGGALGGGIGGALGLSKGIDKERKVLDQRRAERVASQQEMPQNAVQAIDPEQAYHAGLQQGYAAGVKNVVTELAKNQEAAAAQAPAPAPQEMTAAAPEAPVPGGFADKVQQERSRASIQPAASFAEAAAAEKANAGQRGLV